MAAKMGYGLEGVIWGIWPPTKWSFCVTQQMHMY